MARFSTRVKKALLRAVEVVGTSASNLADNAKLRVAEINLETRRREILNDFCLRAYDLWQKGTELPEPLDGMLKELSELDEKLSVLRAQKYAKVEDGKHAATDAEPEDAPADAATACDDVKALDDGTIGEATDEVAATEPATDADTSVVAAPEDAPQTFQADGPQVPADEPASYESTLGETEKP